MDRNTTFEELLETGAIQATAVKGRVRVALAELDRYLAEGARPAAPVRRRKEAAPPTTPGQDILRIKI